VTYNRASIRRPTCRRTPSRLLAGAACTRRPFLAVLDALRDRQSPMWSAPRWAASPPSTSASSPIRPRPLLSCRGWRPTGRRRTSPQLPRRPRPPPPISSIWPGEGRPGLRQRTDARPVQTRTPLLEEFIESFLAEHSTEGRGQAPSWPCKSSGRRCSTLSTQGDDCRRRPDHDLRRGVARASTALLMKRTNPDRRLCVMPKCGTPAISRPSRLHEHLAEFFCRTVMPAPGGPGPTRAPWRDRSWGGRP